jgi:IS30 family transposase
MRDQWSMSNSLKVSLQATIYSLDDRGWSRRRIARELGIDRETVGRHLRLAKPAISTAGFEEIPEVKPAISTVGNGAGRKSQCEPLAAVIMAKAELGLSAQRIYQDLNRGHPSGGGSVSAFFLVVPGRRSWLHAIIVTRAPRQRGRRDSRTCRGRRRRVESRMSRDRGLALVCDRELRSGWGAQTDVEDRWHRH